ncbi:MAG: hypothetical protein ACI9PZ_003103, partial [Parvicella sp.]
MQIAVSQKAIALWQKQLRSELINFKQGLSN